MSSALQWKVSDDESVRLTFEFLAHSDGNIAKTDGRPRKVPHLWGNFEAFWLSGYDRVNVADDVEHIAAVAMRSQEGDLWTEVPPARHHDLINQMVANCQSCAVIANAEQGFYTNKGEFVTRERGMEIALAAGQVVNPEPALAALFSENMW